MSEKPPPVEALSDRPELRARIGKPPLPRHAAAAWQVAEDAILLVWPARPRLPVQATYMNREHTGIRIDGESHDLLAAFLTKEDVDHAAGTWGDDLPRSECRRRRAAAVQGVAAERARARCMTLRALRRGNLPPGSCALGGFRGERELSPVLRYPDGRGWWGSGVSGTPWTWEDNKPSAAPRLLAAGLSEAQCRELAPLTEAADVEAALRRMGVA